MILSESNFESEVSSTFSKQLKATQNHIYKISALSSACLSAVQEAANLSAPSGWDSHINSVKCAENCLFWISATVGSSAGNCFLEMTSDMKNPS
jgi:hypothetical protein